MHPIGKPGEWVRVITEVLSGLSMWRRYGVAQRPSFCLGFSPTGIARLITLLVVALVMVSPGAAGAQPRDAGRVGDLGDAPASGDRSGPVNLDLDYFRGYLHDTRHMAASALAWRPADWLRLSLVVGVTLRLADEDGDLKVWMQNKRSNSTNTVAAVGRPFGDGRYVLPALGTLYCYGRLSGNGRAQRVALLGCESVVISGAITGAVKYLSHKRRPSSVETDEIPWGGPAASTAHLSFPSGHSACAFAVGTVFAKEYEDTPLVPLLAYTAATLCAYSRVNDNAHWVSDVVVGSVIGHLTARAVVARHGGVRTTRLGLEPVLGERGTGLSLSYRF